MERTICCFKQPRESAFAVLSYDTCITLPHGPAQEAEGKWYKKNRPVAPQLDCNMCCNQTLRQYYVAVKSILDGEVVRTAGEL